MEHCFSKPPGAQGQLAFFGTHEKKGGPSDW